MAKSERRPDGSLVVTESGRGTMVIGLISAAVAAFLLIATLRGATDGPRSIALIGGTCALLICLAGLALTERSTFRFDRRRRVLDWRRDRLFSRASGSVRFDDITAVAVTREPTADLVEEPRFGILILETASGPIRLANTTRPRTQLEEVATAIRGVLAP